MCQELSVVPQPACDGRFWSGALLLRSAAPKSQLLGQEAQRCYPEFPALNVSPPCWLPFRTIGQFWSGSLPVPAQSVWVWGWGLVLGDAVGQP